MPAEEEKIEDATLPVGRKGANTSHLMICQRRERRGGLPTQTETLRPLGVCQMSAVPLRDCQVASLLSQKGGALNRQSLWSVRTNARKCNVISKMTLNMGTVTYNDDKASDDGVQKRRCREKRKDDLKPTASI